MAEDAAPEPADATQAPTATEWLARLGRALGCAPPNAGEQEALLALAGIAAHASERIAAPLTCWLVGRSGLSPDESLQLVRG